jgi:hypothetical protein
MNDLDMRLLLSFGLWYQFLSVSIRLVMLKVLHNIVELTLGAFSVITLNQASLITTTN